MDTARVMHTDNADYTHHKSLRSLSSSDVMSASGRSMAGALPPVSPRPQYLAQQPAGELASVELDRTTTISEPALELVNAFLDQTLYNLLSISRSCNLDALRPSVLKLLKPRLGQAATHAANEELKELDEEEPETLTLRNDQRFNPRDFDVELAWKLARLRCMVYTHLGDIEEEDEEEYLEQERLDEHSQNPQMSTSSTCALFLAAALEFLGQQAICTAAQYAEKKHNHYIRKNDVSEVQDGAVLVVEASDMLQLSREGPLSRIWRSWRRDTRMNEPTSNSRPNTPGQVMSPVLGDGQRSRKNSEAVIPEESPTGMPLTPAQIPLPMSERDVDEIEVPGLAPDLDNTGVEEEPELPERSRKRPTSMLIATNGIQAPLSPISPDVQGASDPQPARPRWARARSQSLPTAAQSPYNPPTQTTSRGTIVYSPDQAQAVRNSLKQEEVEPTASTNEPEPSKQIGQAIAADHHIAKQSIIGGTIGAIAGALGVEALRNPRKASHAQDSDSRAKESDDLFKRATVAEQIMGPASTVAPPADAETGSSIRNVGDFDSMYVPSGADTPGTPEPNQQKRHREVSDPEDLALSSADEDDATHSRQPGPRDSGLGVATVCPPATAGDDEVHRPTSAGVSSPISSPTSPSSPRRNREAAVVHDSIIPMRDDDELDEQGNALDKSTPTATKPSNRYSMMIPAGKEQHASAAELPSAWPAVVPARRSSREQPSHAVHSPTQSKSSQYSQTSESSSKRLGYNREPEVGTATLEQQRASFHEAVTSARNSHNASTKQELALPSASGLSSRRQHLRLDTTSDEEAKINEAKKKSLEVLIKGDETLHYTLTPQSARATEFPQSATKPKTQTQELADFFRNTEPPSEVGRPSTGRSARQSINGLRSNPPAQTQSGGVASSNSPISRVETASSKPRSAFIEARDARPERNTTRDLADYARSTGPNKEQQLPSVLGMSAPANNRSGGLGPNGVPKAPVGTPSIHSPRPSSVSDRSAIRLKFQARDARPARDTEAADLIDFIREGPPRKAGDHRIDRTVAPFRTTMDSDDLNALAPPRDVNGRDSLGSAQESSVAARSVQESTNSRTGLLDPPRIVSARVPNGVSPATNGVARQSIPPQGMPQRKRRAPRDPYAIDYDDDDLEEEEPVVKPARRTQDESLIDFLRNTSPPPGMTTQPILAVASRAEGANDKDLRQSASNSKLKNVLGRERSTSQRNGAAPPQTTATSVRNGAPSSPKSNAARAASPHLTQSGSKIDSYRPTKATHAGHVERNRTTRSRGEAREASRIGGGTADLADYLRNSGPPEPVKAPSQPKNPSKDQAGFLKFFQNVRSASIRR